MGRPKGSSNKKAAVDIIAAVDFVTLASSAKIPGYAAHIQFVDGQLLGFNGVLSAGTKCEQTFKICPHADLLKRAMKKCGKTINFNEISENVLSVTSEKFRAVIPCVPLVEMPDVEPDPNIAVIDERIIKGFDVLGPLVKDDAKTVLEASILLQTNTMVATDKVIMCEYWHGNSLPPNLIIPKIFINAVLASKKKPIGFGWSQGKTITFHFDDGSWLKTQLFNEGWPDWMPIINVETHPVSFDQSIFEAVEKVADFSVDGVVYFSTGAVRSHDDMVQGASCEAPVQLMAGAAFNAKKFLFLRGKCDAAELNASARALFAFSNDPPMRAVLATRLRNPNNNESIDKADTPVPVEFQAPAETVEAAPDEPAAWTLPSAPHYTDGDPAPAAQPAPQASAPYAGPTFDLPSDVSEDAIGANTTSGSGAFDLGKHNEHAAANMASADPWKAAYPGIDANVPMSGTAVEDEDE